MLLNFPHLFLLWLNQPVWLHPITQALMTPHLLCPLLHLAVSQSHGQSQIQAMLRYWQCITNLITARSQTHQLESKILMEAGSRALMVQAILIVGGLPQIVSNPRRRQVCLQTFIHVPTSRVTFLIQYTLRRILNHLFCRGDWGLNYDDGPFNRYTDSNAATENKYAEPALYNFLAENNLHSTLFVSLDYSFFFYSCSNTNIVYWLKCCNLSCCCSARFERWPSALCTYMVAPTLDNSNQHPNCS